jgi:hypothetical protein
MLTALFGTFLNSFFPLLLQLFLEVLFGGTGTVN